MKKERDIVSSCSVLDGKIELEEEQLEELKASNLLITIEPKESESSEISIYSTNRRTLSDNIPLLQNLGFIVDSEVSYMTSNSGFDIYSQRYFIEGVDFKTLQNSKENVILTLKSAITSEIKNCSLISLAYLINLPPLYIELIRAITSYEQQLIALLSENIISSVLIKYATLSSLFVEYFKAKFILEFKNRASRLKALESEIEDGIKSVENINEDRALRIFYKILIAIKRTNFYCDGVLKDRALVFKIDVIELLPFLNGVQPRVEAFVYHRLFQGVHLRRKNIARGGIRWSDRYDDFRNEVRLLMQAQRQKNSIITPTGAKGGFVIFKPKPSKDEFETIYRYYINALLDVVDNKSESRALKCENMITYDEEDTYFVVAADKGTANMSDIANSISIDRGFWLKDAFASGDSRGFSHKKMGITAKGSIKSTERFFIEMGKNFYNESTTVIGIGSPAGDVFGNGILLSDKFGLIAAISSREIFIDPTPNLELSYMERKRLFENNLGWSSYDKDKISKGGGVFHKSSKEIRLSNEAKKLFSIKKDVINGEELSRAILTSKADMLFNGGVGTYVKASDESDSQIGDKPNESVRVVAKDIKTLCVCEGGNLGFTQKARMEYAKKGGRISTDSIDNSAGVQTSDYEVNIKIVLNNLLEKGVIDEQKKYELIESLQDDVESIVVWTNYLQALALSLDDIRSQKDLDRFKASIVILEESVDSFKRESFDIPSVDEFALALTKSGSISRPVLSVMLSFAKIFLKSVLLNEKEFVESPFAQKYLFKYFPKSFSTVYQKEIAIHPLKNEIIATYISNKIINTQGVGFIFDFKELGLEKFILKVRSFLVINELIFANDIRHMIFREDYNLSPKKQYDMLLELEDSALFLVNWIIEHGENSTHIFDHFLEYQKSLFDFIESIDNKFIKNFNSKDERLNRYFSMIDYVKMALAIIVIKEQTNHLFSDIANLFFTLTQDLNLINLLNTLANISHTNSWEERLKDGLRVEVFDTIYAIVKGVMKFKRKNETIKEAYSEFAEINRDSFNRYLRDLDRLKSYGVINLVNLSVVVGSLKKITIDLE